MTSLPKIAAPITIKWRRLDQLSREALYELLRFRQQIFVVEQRSPYPDLDGLDQGAWHLLLRSGAALVGCLRLWPPADADAPVRIGRVAVAADLRGRRLGRRLMTEALSFCRDHYPGRPIALSAQLDLVPFYESLGFIPTSGPYDDFGVAHVEMAMHGIAGQARG